VWSVTGVKS